MPVFPSTVNTDCLELLHKSEFKLKELADNLKIAGISDKFFAEIVAPLAVYLNSLEKDDQPLFICFTGGQGSGPFPPNGATIKLISNKFGFDNFVFSPSSNKFRFLRSNKFIVPLSASALAV